MIEIFERGGIMMYPLILASVLAVAIIIERFFSLRKNKIIIPDIINVVEQFSSFQDMELAKNICAKYSGPLSNLIKIGLENSDLDRADIKELIEDQSRYNEILLAIKETTPGTDYRVLIKNEEEKVYYIKQFLFVKNRIWKEITYRKSDSLATIIKYFTEV